MEALHFIQPMYLLQVFSHLLGMLLEYCVPQVKLLWLITDSNNMGSPLTLSPLCRNSSVMCSKTTGLVVAYNFCLSLIVHSVVHSFHVTLLWRFMKQKCGIDIILHNWGTGLVAQNIFDIITLEVLCPFSHCLWRQSFVVQTPWCTLMDSVQVKIQVFALGFICSLHE
jgi:hypothetical protein